MSDPLQSLFSRCDSVLVFDTETSGVSWQRDEIIEFSAIRLTASGTEEVDEFVRCTRSLPPRIVELTGITDDLLREEGIGKQAFAELLAALLTPGTMLAAYNAQFDLLFLYAFLQKYGDARLLQDKQKLDLLTVYRDRRAYPHRLCNAIEQYDLQDRVTNSHRAIDDVRATVEVLRAMGTERDDLERYVDLFGYSSKYGISGPRISSVRYLPQGYEPKAAGEPAAGLPLCADGGRCTHGLRQDDGRQLVSRQRGAATLYPHQRLFRPPCHSLAKRAGGLCPRRVPVPA